MRKIFNENTNEAFVVMHDPEKILILREYRSANNDNKR